MQITKIEWADCTWSPVTGCTKVSPGCANCYAERMARRFAGRAGYPEAPHHFDVTLHPERLEQPLHWKEPRRIFVCSMGDLFHKDVPADYIKQVYEVMKFAQHHIFIILTKRPERICSVLYGEEGHWFLGGGDVISNVWHLTTTENQETAAKRIPQLLELRRHADWDVLGVSVEPLLGPLNLSHWLRSGMEYWIEGHPESPDPARPDGFSRKIPGLNWCITGAETGPHKRPMALGWAIDLRDQCIAADIPFFFKKSSTGLHTLDGELYEQYPNG